MTIDPIGGRTSAPGGVESAERGGEHFAAALARMLQDANRDQLNAASEIRALVDGEGSIHDAMVAMSKAEGSFALLMEMRNRMVAAVNQLLQTNL